MFFNHIRKHQLHWQLPLKHLLRFPKKRSDMNNINGKKIVVFPLRVKMQSKVNEKQVVFRLLREF